jgi:hypothetical protein
MSLKRVSTLYKSISHSQGQHCACGYYKKVYYVMHGMNNIIVETAVSNSVYHVGSCNFTL